MGCGFFDDEVSVGAGEGDRHRAGVNADDGIHREGEPAPKTGRLRETIGPPECPIMHRWKLVKTRFGKLLLHHFLPNADDRAEHDHPSSFITVVLAGGYVDYADGRPSDTLRRGSVRFRPAEHTHRARVGPRGCWTLVLMGPKRREWGFWKDGKWWPWREHERRFGFGMRCPGDDSSPLDGGHPGQPSTETKSSKKHP